MFLCSGPFAMTDTHLPEMTLRGVILGALITVVFTASNVYLGLKVGMTFGTSIPAAVISMALLRLCAHSNILENNMVQTQASAAGTLSTVIFIVPALIMLGYWQSFELWQTLLLCVFGGFLGVLFTIPLRRTMIIESDLPYPEGRAAAEILKAGSARPGEDASQNKDTGLKEIVTGAGISGAFSLFSSGFHVFAGGWSSFFLLGGGTAATGLSFAFSSAVVAAGYLIGIASGISMLVGAALAWCGFVPYLTSFAGGMGEATVADFAMGIWASKVRLVGVGAIGIAAIWTLIVLSKSVSSGLRGMFSSAVKANKTQEVARKDLNLSPKACIVVFGISVVGLLFVFYDFVKDVGLSPATTVVFVIVGLVLAVVVGFLVASACAYMAGLLGSSSSPISGITILGVLISALTVLAVSKAFDLLSLEGGMQFATAYAIFIASVITAVACVSNDNMQDLKTGQLVEATPWCQQIALMIGCVSGAIVIAPVMNLLFEAYGFVGAMPREGMDVAAALSAPQATLMTIISRGIFQGTLDWTYILIGIAIGVVAISVDEMLKRSKTGLSLSPLAIGFGIYLPAGIILAVATGAIISWLVRRYTKQHATEEGQKKSEHRGVLFASGLIVGESMIGVLIAFVVVFSVSTGGGSDPLGLVGPQFAPVAEVLGLIAFLSVLAVFVRRVLSAAKA